MATDANDILRARGADGLRETIDAGIQSHGGAELLDEIEHYIDRFVAYPSEHAHVAHVLWIGHCHLMDCWESTPRIALLSAEPAKVWWCPGDLGHKQTYLGPANYVRFYTLSGHSGLDVCFRVESARK